MKSQKLKVLFLEGYVRKNKGSFVIRTTTEENPNVRQAQRRPWLFWKGCVEYVVEKWSIQIYSR